MGRMPLQKWIINMRMVEKRLERQRRKMKKDEQKMMREVKQAIENDDMNGAKLFAKDIARNRKMAHNLQKLRSQVKGIGYKLEQASAVQTISGDLRGLVRTLGKINRQIAIPQMENILFAMESEIETLNLTTETLDEGLEAVGATDDDVGVDSEASQIIEEIQTAGAVKSGLPVPADSREKEINSRLEKLKGDKK
uniref:Putative Vps2/24/46-like protein n=1 Tax=uncultured organism TaxID=155900 RepID=A0A0F6PZW2_9ZZZZ|nr:putative Vps2/24/46-like protein [uncultured organism]